MFSVRRDRPPRVLDALHQILVCAEKNLAPREISIVWWAHTRFNPLRGVFSPVCKTFKDDPRLFGGKFFLEETPPKGENLLWKHPVKAPKVWARKKKTREQGRQKIVWGIKPRKRPILGLWSPPPISRGFTPPKLWTDTSRWCL